MSGAPVAPRKSPRGISVKVGDTYALRVGERIALVVVRGSTIEQRGGALGRKARVVTVFHCETLDTHRMVRATARRLRIV